MPDWQPGLRATDFNGIKPLLHPRAGARGRCCAALLQASNLWDRLMPFGAVVAGTIPLGLDWASSDIDILLHTPDLPAFIAQCPGLFAGFAGYHCHQRGATSHVGPAVVVKLLVSHGASRNEEVEVFATCQPTQEQYGFRHMVVEARILHVCGDGFAARVRALKQAGLKTEPAFAQLLGISDDPYLALNSLFDYSPQMLEHWLAARWR
ncbi:DUF4269 domain-containing protein [Thalassospira sp. TSL5-1]|uniref:DUF4269 domain-containing protein n=1 Tax=Thalassospira sp. TSL5-1 TaxID=1544451 RepID=UPI00093CB1EE|nr:DUF4269 domain-containing protein [Thalassospira sp. TSL5-1]